MRKCRAVGYGGVRGGGYGGRIGSSEVEAAGGILWISPQVIREGSMGEPWVATSKRGPCAGTILATKILWVGKGPVK
jgi:hypothetical protein